MRLYIIVIFLFLSCSKKGDEHEIKYTGNNSIFVEYAKGFTIEKYDSIYKLNIRKPFQQASTGFSYWLIPKKMEVPDSLLNENVIKTPVNNIVVTSTSHIPMLDYLGETQALAGFPTPDLVSSEKMRQRIDSGFVTDLGKDSELNFELLVRLQPELVMSYMLTGDRTQMNRIKNAEIPVIINADYLEQHPLGRAEWIKVAGLLFDKSTEADSIFNFIAHQYNELAENVADIKNQPDVMTGIMYGDTWFIPGGENYASNLFEDAGLNYLWKHNEETGFLQLNFETVYNKAHDADLWIGTASIEELQALKNTDSRYTWFEPYKKGEVYTYTKLTGPTGGNQYLELGYLRPDLILGDLIQIAHPEFFEDRELVFYKKLD